MKLMVLLFFYAMTILVIFIVFVRDMRIIQRLKREIGEITLCWSTKLDPRIPVNRVKIFILISYFLWACYWLLSDFHSNYGHFCFQLFLILLSFSLRWNVYIGSNGILIGRNPVFWSEIRSWELKNRKRLFLKSRREGTTEIWEQKFLVPAAFAEKIDKHLRKNTQGNADSPESH